MNNAKRNWITTIFGILMLAMGGLRIYENPAKATDPEVIAMIGGGAGLIAAKDGDKTGTAAPEATTK
ncbi:MAG TPA: hypothetical protein VN428_27085 [Bryobacteraceae bacterium]|nr:hypothetical protein [Bryobacteraceae bacterium]